MTATRASYVNQIKKFNFFQKQSANGENRKKTLSYFANQITIVSKKDKYFHFHSFLNIIIQNENFLKSTCVLGEITPGIELENTTNFFTEVLLSVFNFVYTNDGHNFKELEGLMLPILEKVTDENSKEVIRRLFHDICFLSLNENPFHTGYTHGFKLLLSAAYQKNLLTENSLNNFPEEIKNIIPAMSESVKFGPRVHDNCEEVFIKDDAYNPKGETLNIFKTKTRPKSQEIPRHGMLSNKDFTMVRSKSQSETPTPASSPTEFSQKICNSNEPEEAVSSSDLQNRENANTVILGKNTTLNDNEWFLEIFDRLSGTNSFSILGEMRDRSSESTHSKDHTEFNITSTLSNVSFQYHTYIKKYGTGIDKKTHILKDSDENNFVFIFEDKPVSNGLNTKVYKAVYYNKENDSYCPILYGNSTKPTADEDLQYKKDIDKDTKIFSTETGNTLLTKDEFLKRHGFKLPLTSVSKEKKGEEFFANAFLTSDPSRSSLDAILAGNITVFGTKNKKIHFDKDMYLNFCSEFCRTLSTSSVFGRLHGDLHSKNIIFRYSEIGLEHKIIDFDKSHTLPRNKAPVLNDLLELFGTRTMFVFRDNYKIFSAIGKKLSRISAFFRRTRNNNHNLFNYMAERMHFRGEITAWQLKGIKKLNSTIVMDLRNLRKDTRERREAYILKLPEFYGDCLKKILESKNREKFRVLIESKVRNAKGKEAGVRMNFTYGKTI